MIAIAALAALVVAVGGAFLGLGLVSADLPLGEIAGDAYLRRVVVFTLVQAGLSAVLAVGLAIPLARAFARQDAFFGRSALLRLFTLPPIMPALVAVLGIASVYGGSGWLNRALAASAVEFRVPLYGLTGILIAHVFFNLPLATRLLLQAWQAVPSETWRLAAQLGMGSGAIWRLIEAPLIRRHVPGIAGLVFLLCMLSFTTVLTLGGGPRATTIEVAIYQALRFDFAPERAALLALLQLALCVSVLALWSGLAAPMALAAGLDRRIERPDGGSGWGRAADLATIALAAAFVLSPILAVILAGLGRELPRILMEASVWGATLTSLFVAGLSSLLATALAAGLLAGARALRRDRRRIQWAGALVSGGFVALGVPPLVLATGWFVLLRPFVDPLDFALPVVVAVNALMGLPYLVRALDPALVDLEERYGRLCASLGLAGWTRFRLIDWRSLRRPFGYALGFAITLSLGDLGAMALFGGRDTATLPLLLYQRMGAYRLEEAAAIALLLAGLSFGIFAATERMARDER